jgi:AAA+ ATPase superfamily predicted ATPase
VFIDRQAELQLLQQRYETDQAEFFVLYGRRRVGKTELLAQFCRDKRHIFFVADLDVEPVLRAALSSAVNRELLGPEAASAVYPSWQDILILLAQHAQAERLVVVLDEFTMLVSFSRPTNWPTRSRRMPSWAARRPTCTPSPPPCRCWPTSANTC